MDRAFINDRHPSIGGRRSPFSALKIASATVGYAYAEHL
jgi:hypothetical protein